MRKDRFADVEDEPFDDSWRTAPGGEDDVQFGDLERQDALDVAVLDDAQVRHA